MKRILCLCLSAFLALSIGGCQSLTQPTGGSRTYQAAGAGAALGGLTGALIDSSNPWRGGVIGGAIGAVVGGTLTEIAAKGSQEAATSNQNVQYTTEQGRVVYRADPVSYDPATKCHVVRERIWEDGVVVWDDMRQVCR